MFGTKHAELRRGRRVRSTRRVLRDRVGPLELLERRAVPAVTATFSPQAGVLTVLGDALDNTITVSRDAAGKLLVNGGAVAIQGGTATVANTVQVSIFGQGGNDRLTIDEASGALPAAVMFGGAGNDTLTGGSGGDQLFGQEGSDVLLGKGGNDTLFGGLGNDTLTGGDGDDLVFGESGNDRMIWNPGDDTDLNEGGDGIDTIEVNGGNGAEAFTLTANGARVRFDRITPAPFSLDIGTSEKLVLNANGGNDTFAATGNLAALIQITVNGGAGNDTILGSNGADVLLGGDGNDFIDGQQGNDTVFLGAGDDLFQWDPGDGNDVVEGQTGADRMLFNGANVSEIFEISANGSRVRFTRNVANIVMDLNGVETIDLNARGGGDAINVRNMAGTALKQINLNLESFPGSGVGDGSSDVVSLNGRGGADTVEVTGSGIDYAVVGLPARVSVHGSEGLNDQLILNTLGGDDFVSAATLPAGTVRLTVDGGAGRDTILGSRGDDVLIGGDGNDCIDGNQGNDVAFLGAGDDLFLWDPGDGNDVVEGQAGADRMLFNGANVSEIFEISANGSRVRFTRNVANIVMDLNGVETIDLNALGGADTITVGDLSGTDVAQVRLNLAGVAGGTTGDTQPDSVLINGTNAADTIAVTGSGTSATVTGLRAKVVVTNSEGALDRLTINALGGDDVIDASGLKAGVTSLALNGGLGADLLIGSAGDDLVSGGDGDDVALLGAGNDVFVWNPGDDNDVIEGQAGFDRMIFNGANVSENIDISANGGRVRFTRNVANVTMDLNDVEAIDFNALGGADVIVVNDLSGTDVTEVNLNLASVVGGGDGQPDTVIVQGTSGGDVITVAGDSSGVSVLGLAARVNITGSESFNDRLTINALAGDDVVDASGLRAGAIVLVADGGDDDDVLIGSDGPDVLLGGAGDDVLIGGPGFDVLDGGPGNNIVIQ